MEAEDLFPNLSKDEIIALINFYKEFSDNKLWVPPGDYYSPIPSKNFVLERKDSLYGNASYNGIDINENGQLVLLSHLKDILSDQKFNRFKSNSQRYYYQNDWFPLCDAMILCALIRYYKPRKIIEVGSGFSSAVMLDTNDYFFNSMINFTFIEPNTKRLNSLLTTNDKKLIDIKEVFIQDVDLNFFQTLIEGDILFIDSSHVAKTASDVNFIFFEILPRLKKGVIIHFHDIFSNFEYPLEWVLEGRSWNESYLLKSFLQYNNSFEIVLYISYLENFHNNFLKGISTSLIRKNSGSIWLKKKV